MLVCMCRVGAASTGRALGNVEGRAGVVVAIGVDQCSAAYRG